MKVYSRSWFAAISMLIVTGSLLCEVALSQTEKGTPNILFIAVDDLRPEVTLNEHFANQGFSTYSIGKICTARIFARPPRGSSS